MTSKRRFVILVVAVLAALFGVAIRHILASFLVAFDKPLVSGFSWSTLDLAGALVGIASFIAFVLYKPAAHFADDVGSELEKVSWPERQEAVVATRVVVVTVLVGAGFLGLFDAIWGWLTHFLLRSSF